MKSTEEYINTAVVNLHETAPFNLEYSAEIEKQLSSIAQQGYPYEVCGFLLGDKESPYVVKQIIEVKNSAAQKERRFEIAPLDYLNVEKEALNSDKQLIGIFHSHPEYPAIPSEHDLKFAVEGFAYPIISIDGNGLVLIRSWILENGKFINQNIKISELWQQ